MPWCIGAFLVTLCVSFPLFFLVKEVFKPSSAEWKYLTENPNAAVLDPEILALLTSEEQAAYLPTPPNLWQQAVNSVFYSDFHTSILYQRLMTTLGILLSVATLSLIVGVVLAWLVSVWTFPTRRLLVFLLALPITIPSYVMASSYKLLTADLQHSSGIWIRENHGAEQMQDFDHYWNLFLLVCVLTCCFYPYVFLAARSAFSHFSLNYIESSKSLGKGSFYTYRQVVLPLVRPAIIGGLMLVCLETLNEYGAMKIIGVETLLTEIFRLRSGANDLNTAVRVSACIMGIVLFLLILEQLLRGKRRFHASRSRNLQQSLKKPPKAILGFIYLFSLCIFCISFALPFGKLIQLAYFGLQSVQLSDFLPPILDSVKLAGSASICMLIIALFLGYAQRKVPHPALLIFNKISSLGYAIPGAILGIALISWTGEMLQHSSTSSLIQTLFYQSTVGLIIGYSIRFLTVSLNPIEAGLKSIHHHLDEASAQLGKNSISTFFSVHFPLLKPSMIAGFLILFVDVLKELPLTLIISPFDTETLAMQTYSLFAVQEEYNQGAIPSLILIVTGIIGMLTVQILLFSGKKSSH